MDVVRVRENGREHHARDRSGEEISEPASIPGSSEVISTVAVTAQAYCACHF